MLADYVQALNEAEIGPIMRFLIFCNLYHVLQCRMFILKLQIT